MTRSSLLRYGFSVVLLAAPLSGCELILGIGGELPLETGGAGGGGNGGGGGGTGGMTTGGPCNPGEKVECYTGPEDTKSVGACKPGLTTCSEEGAWGPCEGEVVPAPETCLSPADDDCDGKDDCTSWVKTILADVYASGVGVDAQGNIVVSVEFTSSVDFGDGMPVSPVGFADIALLKYDKAGTLLWKKVYGAAQTQQVNSLAVDAAGNIALGGTTAGEIDFGKGSLPSGGYVAKLDPSGQALWSISAQSPAGPPSVDRVAIDSKGNVLVGGNAGVIDFGQGPLQSGDAQSFYVAKLDAATGQPIWSKITKGSAVETIAGLAVDSSDSPVLTGTWNGAYLGLAAAGGTPPNDVYNPNGENAIFLLRLDPDGNMSHGKLMAGLNMGFAGTVAGLGVDKFGWSTLVGDFTGLIEFNDAMFDAGPGGGMWVARDQTTSFGQWAKGFFASDVFGNFSGVAIDGSGGIAIWGRYEGPADFGGGALPPAAAGVVVKLDKDGGFLWNRAYPFGDGGFRTMAAGSLEDETVLAGTFYGSANFGDGVITAPQGFFLVRLPK